MKFMNRWFWKRARNPLASVARKHVCVVEQCPPMLWACRKPDGWTSYHTTKAEAEKAAEEYAR